MYQYPNEILTHILSFADEKSILNLIKLSKRINNLVDIKFWCQLLIERKKYDDFTFCYVYNNDEIVYHKSYIECEEIEDYDNPNLSNLVFDVNRFSQLWDTVQILPYDQFAHFCYDNNLHELALCFAWSLHKINLYQTFRSSPFGFYKVLLSALNWKESCRHKSHEVCGNDTPIFSPFCRLCRMQEQPVTLLNDVINKTGPFYLSPFDKLKKEEYIKYNDIQFYYTKDGKYIVFQENDITYCVGILKNKILNLIEKCDNNEIIKRGFVRDTKYYDFLYHHEPYIEINGDRKLEVIPFIDNEFFIITDSNFIVTEDEVIICVGKLENNIVVELDDREIKSIKRIGLTYYDMNETKRIALINEVNEKLRK